MAGKGSKKSYVKAIVTLDNLSRYRGYIFTFFSEAALKLCARRGLEELNAQNMHQIIGEVNRCVSEEIEVIRSRNKDPCIAPLALTGNDPKDKLNLCYAHKVLTEFLTGYMHGGMVLPPALSLEFAEYVRSFMGPGKAKRDLFLVDEEVLALSVIGAYLLNAYAIGGEYGYVYIDVAPFAPITQKVRKMERAAKSITKAIMARNGSIASVIVGIASVASLHLGKLSRDIAQKGGYVVANFIRISRTGNKVLLKGFDSVDIIQLIRILRASRTSKAVYTLLRNYPPEEFNNLRRFVEVLSQNLLKFQSFRKPIYIYEILRFLTSDELNKEGVQYYVKSKKVPGWNEIVAELMNLHRLVA